MFVFSRITSGNNVDNPCHGFSTLYRRGTTLGNYFQHIDNVVPRWKTIPNTLSTWYHVGNTFPSLYERGTTLRKHFKHIINVVPSTYLISMSWHRLSTSGSY